MIPKDGGGGGRTSTDEQGPTHSSRFHLEPPLPRPHCILFGRKVAKRGVD